MMYSVPGTVLLLVAFLHSVQAQQLIDPRADPRTKALYSNLFLISEKGFMFGHQDDDAYGVTWKAEKGRSDVKDICGSYPAVHGWDIGKSLEIKHNIDSVRFKSMLKWMKQIRKRGGINTVSWHWDNPVTKGSSWDKTSAVKDILPGGQKHDVLTQHLDLLARFFKKSKSPIIFRPWHEHNGDWFWWGKGNCTEEEYIQLWRFTVDYLRDEKQVHNLIYAFSPDRSRIDSAVTRKSYLYGYPGDNYVDLLGIDNYMDVGVAWNRYSPEEQRASFVRSLKMVSDLAKEKNKVAALTETGQEGVKNSSWFTEVILSPIKDNDIQIAYVLVWRNANDKHHYAPYKGHSSAENFLEFCRDEKTFLESDIQHIYETDKPLTR